MFTKEIIDLTMSLDALNDFREYIEPLVWKKVKKQYEAEAEAMEILTATFNIVDKLPPDATQEELDKAKAEISKLFVDEIDIVKDDDGWSLTTSGEDGEKIDTAVTNYKLINKQLELMYKSILINLVSTVECFVRDILKRYFLLYKNEGAGKLYESKDKIYTIHELDEFDSIEEAKEYVIDKRIENIIRGSFGEWIKFIKSKLSLNMGYMTCDYDDIVEIFERRNLFTHNDGIINRIYISNVKKDKRFSDKIGKHIILNKQYLENAIFILEKNILLMAFELWKNKEKSDSSRGELLTELAEKIYEARTMETLRKCYDIYYK